MNNFTKDELEFILNSIYFDQTEHYLEKDIPEYPKKLMDKIQSLIDNYCEHEWQETAKEDTFFICTKCEEEST